MKRQSLLSACRTRRSFALLCATGALFTGSAAQAQLSPYFVRVSERISYDSNVFRVSDAVGRRRDGISLTSLTVGLDQPIGRQRFYASATADYTAYKNNDQLNGPGYNLVGGLAWEAASKLSGDARLSFSQAQANPADYGSTLQNFQDRNEERVALLDLRGQYGGASLLAIEALANHTEVNYSSQAFTTRERKSSTLGGGLRYRPSTDLSVGFIVRGTRGKYPQGIVTPGGLAPDDYTRRDFDFVTSYAASGISSFTGRLSYTKEEHDQLASRDFSGLTGDIGWTFRPTGKLEFGASLARETGSGATPGLSRVAGAGSTGAGSGTTGSTTATGGTGSTSPVGGTGITASGTGVGYLNDARVSDRLRLQAIWDATAKIRLTGTASYSRDRYDAIFVLNNFGTLSSERGNTHGVNLAARYLATRVWSFECGAGRESRNAGSGLASSYNYDATTGFCSALLALD